MLLQTEQDTIQQIVVWLRNRVVQERMPIEFPAGNGARLDAGVLASIPAVVKGDGDAGDKADMLQRLEDAWNEQKPADLPEVLLIPAVA